MVYKTFRPGIHFKANKCSKIGNLGKATVVMKILFVKEGINYGGASKMMVSVANNLCKEHDVTLLTFRRGSKNQVIDERVHYEFNKLYSNRFKPIEIVGQIINLHKYIKKNNVDLVIAFLHPSHYMAVLAGIGTKAKILLSERGDPYSRVINGSLYVRIVERIIQHADAYVFQSKGASEAYPIRCQKKGIIIPNALPTRAYPTYKINNNKIILCVARLEILQKRQDILISAFDIFVKRHPDYKLLFAGDGPDLDKLRNISESKGLSDKIVFLGARNDVLDLLMKATIFVLSSDYEGLPNALLEAMAVGVPCISTDCSPGGARMIIEDGVNGFIVPCGDPEALSERMCELAASEELRRKYSTNARGHVLNRFEQEKIDKAWRDFVNEKGKKCF